MVCFTIRHSHRRRGTLHLQLPPRKVHKLKLVRAMAGLCKLEQCGIFQIRITLHHNDHVIILHIQKAAVLISRHLYRDLFHGETDL